MAGEPLRLQDVGTVRALAEPTRMAILNALADGPMSVKDLAGRLGRAPDRLYYHLRRLEEHGLVEATDGPGERVYAATADEFALDERATDELRRAGLEAFFGVFRRQLLAAAATRPGSMGAGNVTMRMRPERWRELLERLIEVGRELAEADADAPDAEDYSLLVALHPIVDADDG